MNSPCDFPQTRHDVGLACENDRRLVTRMSKRPTLGASLMSNKIKSQKQGNQANSPCIPALPRVGHNIDWCIRDEVVNNAWLDVNKIIDDRFSKLTQYSLGFSSIY
jgi:hypothetical protein